MAIDTKFNLKHKSHVVSQGPDRAAARSMLRATGLKDEDMDKPFISVANLASDVTPCNVHLNKLAKKVKEGVWDSGAVPFMFGTITVSDGVLTDSQSISVTVLSVNDAPIITSSPASTDVEIGTTFSYQLTASDVDDIVFFQNPTTSINEVMRSLDLQKNDEILTTNHEYGAIDKTWEYVCSKTGSVYKKQEIPLPIKAKSCYASLPIKHQLTIIDKPANFVKRFR